MSLGTTVADEKDESDPASVSAGLSTLHSLTLSASSVSLSVSTSVPDHLYPAAASHSEGGSGSMSVGKL